MVAFSKIRFSNSAKQTLRQIYAVIYYMNNGIDHTDAINKAIDDFPSVKDYQTIADKCARRFAGNIPLFLDWYRHGLILNRLIKKFSLNDQDIQIFSELLEGNIYKVSESENETDYGAGFGNPEENEKVEKAAIKLVTESYENNGWAVESVESENLGFDLICSNDNYVENVEVKGISGNKEAFILTRNEYKQIKKNDKFVLCVVTNTLNKNIEIKKYRGSSISDKFSFEPLQYFVAKTITGS
jgi:hypothetical protein